MPLEESYTTSELAKELGIPISTLRGYVRTGKLKPTGSRKSNRGKPTHVFSRNEVRRFIQWRYGKTVI